MVESPQFDYKREFKNVLIRTMDGSTLSGKVNIGIKERVSDLFTKSESPFVILFDAGYKDTQGKVFIVNKNNILWVEPEE